MARLPQPGQDQGTWGQILNDYLSEAHNGDGSLRDIPQSKITGLINALDEKLTGSLATLDARYRGLGTANNPITNASAVRPTELPVVYWQCSTQPLHWLSGDIWLKA